MKPLAPTAADGGQQRISQFFPRESGAARPQVPAAASRVLDIPVPELPQLPSPSSHPKKRVKYNKTAVETQLQAVLEMESTSLAAACRKFDVPKSSLRRWQIKVVAARMKASSRTLPGHFILEPSREELLAALADRRAENPRQVSGDVNDALFAWFLAQRKVGSFAFDFMSLTSSCSVARRSQTPCLQQKPELWSQGCNPMPRGLWPAKTIWCDSKRHIAFQSVRAPLPRPSCPLATTRSLFANFLWLEQRTLHTPMAFPRSLSLLLMRPRNTFALHQKGPSRSKGHEMLKLLFVGFVLAAP